MLKEFKDFALQGNMLDIAVGIVIGGAFTAVVNAIVEYLIMPLVGGLTAGIDFTQLKVSVMGADFPYGRVITSLIQFLVIALVLFFIVKSLNKMKKEEPVRETTKTCPYCKTAIDIEATRCPNCTSELEAVVVE